MAAFNTKKLIKLSLVSLALTPLVITPGLFPYIFGKVSFIRLVIAIVSLLVLVGIIKDKGFPHLRPRRLANPITYTLVFFFLAVLISTPLAVNPYRAFWGDVERSEGFLIYVYALLFFIGTLVFFERKDWLLFLKFHLLVGGLVGADAAVDWLVGDARPDGSFLGNPVFVAIYALFTIFFALTVCVLEKKRVWRFWGTGIAVLSTVVIFATKTRGVIVGLMAFLVAALLYLASSRARGIRVNLFGKPVAVRRLAAAALLLVIVLSVTFVFTRQSPAWKRVPGLDRLARVSATDATTQTRLLNLSTSLKAVNPASVGIIRALFGWGLEGYITAHNQFYNPSIQKYEYVWFDRAHNKLLDVLVMNGALGLLAYLLLWGAVFRVALGKRVPARGSTEDTVQPNERLWISLIVGCTAIAYFVQSLFVFDNIAIYIPLFSFLGFVAHYYYSGADNTVPTDPREKRWVGGLVGATVLVTCLWALFVWSSVIPFRQMNIMVGGFRRGGFDTNAIKTMTTPDNYIQAELRPFALLNIFNRLSQGEFGQSFPKMIGLDEAVLGQSSNQARAEGELGLLYTKAYIATRDRDWLPLGEKHLRRSSELVVGRQDVLFYLASNLVSQGRFEEAKEVIITARNFEPEGQQMDMFYLKILAPYDFDGRLDTLGLLGSHFLQERNPLGGEEAKQIRESYRNYLDYAYETRNDSLFRGVMRQAIKIERTMREIIDSQTKEGITTIPIDTIEADLQRALNGFDSYGWSVIKLE